VAANRTTTLGVVLVIDDDPGLRVSLASLLQSHGYRVIEARHGKDGLDRLSEERPDVILLDLNMPVMDGWEFRAEQQRLLDERLAAVPVLLCTAELDGDKHRKDLNASALIEKPFDLDRVLHAVNTAVRGVV
jgi:CheY-like chemotaxis protein